MLLYWWNRKNTLILCSRIWKSTMFWWWEVVGLENSLFKQSMSIDEFFFFFRLLKRVWYSSIISPSRRVALLVGYQSTHGLIEDFPGTSNVEAIIFWKIQQHFYNCRCQYDHFSEKTILIRSTSINKTFAQCKCTVSYGIIEYEMEWHRSKDCLQLQERNSHNWFKYNTNLEEKGIEPFNYERLRRSYFGFWFGRLKL